MNVLVVVALVVGVSCLAVTVVAAVALWRSIRELRAAGTRAAERIAPLTAELAAEQAVTALELDALQRTTRRSPVPQRRS